MSNKKKFALSFLVLAFLILIIFINYTRREPVSEKPYEITQTEEEARAKADPSTLNIVYFYPRGEVREVNEIKAVFSRDMVSEDKLNIITDTFPVSVSPEIPIQFKWIAQNELIIISEEELQPGTKYIFNFLEGIKDLKGGAIEREFSYEFINTPLSLDNFFIEEDKRVLRLIFNAPVTAGSLSENAEFKANGKKLEFNVLTKPSAEVHRVLFEEKIEDPLNIKLSAGLNVINSNYERDEDIKKVYDASGKNSVRHLRSYEQNGIFYIQVDFKEAIDGDIKQAVESFIEIEPELKTQAYRARWYNRRLTLSASEFNYGETYAVKIKRGVFGVATDFFQIVKVPDARPSLKILEDKHIVSSKGKTVLPIETINVDTVSVTAYDIYKNNIINFATTSGYSADPRNLAKQMEQKHYPIEAELNEKVKNFIDLKELFKDEYGPKIVYVYHNNYYRPQKQLILITDLGIFYKEIDGNLTALVTSLQTALPVEGAEVKIYSQANQLLASANTDALGLVRFKDADFEDGSPFAVTVEKDNDINFLVINRGHLPTVSFDVSGARYMEEKDIECFIYGEREIYKPSEKVNLKLMAKDKDMLSMSGLPLTVKIVSPSGDEVYNGNHKTSELGTAEFIYESNLKSVTGFYNVRAYITGMDKEIGNARFQIEDFVPDRIETKIEKEKDEYSIDEEINLKVSSQYLFGKPASGNKVSAVSTLESARFSSSKYSGYIFYNSRAKFSPVFKEYGESKLDEEGNIDYKIKLDKHTPPGALDFVFTATVFEIGAKGVSATEKMMIHPYPYYIGIKGAAQNSSDYRRGETAKFNIIAVDPEGQTKDARVKITVKSIEWNYVLKMDANENYRYHWEKEETERMSEIINVGRQGAVYNYLVNDYGSYVIYAEDVETKMTTAAEFSTGWWWRSDRRDKADDFEKIEIKTDKSSYSERETARIDFTLPFDGIMYLFVEQNDIKYLTRVNVKDKKASMRLNLDESHIPGIYISAVLVSPLSEAQFSNYRAFGVKYIKVVPDNKDLVVAVDIPKNILPGREAEIKITAIDKYGTKQNGEVSLSVVDRGVLQLSRLDFGGPFDHYFRKRGNWVKNSDIFSFIRDEPKESIIRTLVSAGDVMARAPEKHKPAFQIKKEKVVSFWYPSLRLKDGAASVKIKMPEFSGLLDFRATAVTQKAMGYYKISKEIKEPLVFNASYPEAVCPGDEFEVPVSVMSNLKEDAEARLTLVLKGPGETSFKEEKIKIKAGGEIQRTLKIKVKDEIGVLDFSFNLKAKDIDITKTKEISVRPPVPEVSFKKLFEVNPGYKGALNLKGGFVRGTESHRIIFSKMPVGDVLAGLQFLVRYPYGCVEQTTSSVFPQLYLNDILQEYVDGYSNKEAIDRNIIDGINRLIKMLTPDGGFAAWRGGRNSYPYGTVYAANFLFEAKNKNYPVPERTIKGLKGYLNNIIKYNKNDSIRAYACYVLSIGGEHHDALASELIDKVSWPEKAYLITVLARAGRHSQAAEYINVSVPSVSVSRTTGGYLTSNVKSTAVILSALIDLNENHSQITSMAHSLLRSANYRGHWGTTQDNAFVVIALGKYINKFKVGEADFKGTLYSKGKKVVSFSEKEDASAELETLDGLTVDMSGKTAPLIYVISRGIPENFDVKEVKSKMDIKRKFFTADGKEHKSREFEFGELYIVELKISSDRNYSNMFVEDMIPGGFFIENPRIATRVYEIPHLKHGLRVDYEDIKNDRVIVFFNGGREQTYRYLVRAGVKGKFAYPAVKGGCMYDADVEALIKTPPVTVK